MSLDERDFGEGAGMLFYERLPDGTRGRLLATLAPVYVDVEGDGNRELVDWQALLIRNDMTVRGRNRNGLIAVVRTLADGGAL